MRENARAERLAVYDYMSREDHRGRRYGIQPYEISEETELDIEATMVALGWLRRQGLVEKLPNRHGWRFAKIFPVRFCWIHGKIKEATLDCPKCVRKGLRAGSNNQNREEKEGNLFGNRGTELHTTVGGTERCNENNVGVVSG